MVVHLLALIGIDYGNYLYFIIFLNWCISLSLGITLHDEALDWAAAGDHVSLTVTGMDIIKIKWVCKENLIL